jgi:murein DD-endopeptidase MepM/ murein hydrolase activator NlpD
MRSLDLASTVFVTGLFVMACGGEKAPPASYIPRYPVANAGYQGGPLLYRLPVVGNWRVQRTHYGAANDQAYALDLVIDAPAFSPGMRGIQDFPSYNQPIVADAPGMVVIAVDGVPENAIGFNNSYDMHGNFVVIDHQNGEFSLFAHLIPGSLKVRPGVFVAAGTEIGRCGNSGHSTMPHLHWQVMSNANATGAIGIPPRFVPYERNGAMSTDLPQKGDRLTAR